MTNDNHISDLKKSVASVSSRLAHRKSQRSFLDTVLKWDLCSSVRPKIGKSFSSRVHESQKSEFLEECRVNLVKISIDEADSDISMLRKKFKDLLLSSQELQSKDEYGVVSWQAKRRENFLNSQRKKHRNKLVFHCQRTLDAVPNDVIGISDVYYIPEKPIKHSETRRLKCNRKNRRRRLKEKAVRHSNISRKVQYIKDNSLVGLVANFTNIEIPNSAYLYLSKGISFVPAVSSSKHDLVFDGNEFLRKSFHTQPDEEPSTTSQDTSHQNSVIEKKLRLQSYS